MNKKWIFIILLLVLFISSCTKKNNNNNNNDNNLCTVTFDSDGGTEIASIQVEKGSPIPIVDNPVKEGYIFDGWYYGDEKWSFISNVVLIDTKLTAKWINNYVTVSFNTNGGSNINNINVKKGELIPTPNNPTKEGYSFIEWYCDGVKWDFNSNKVNNDIVLYAEWLANTYVVTFDVYGGSGISQSSFYVKFGTEVSLPSPIKLGYTFYGWYNGNQKVESGKWMIASNVTLLAKYNPNEYTITFDSDGGQGLSSNTMKVKYDENYTLPIPYKEGYNFLGWYNGNEKVTSGLWKQTDNISLKAKWGSTLNNYKSKWDLNTLSFNGNGMEIVIKVLPKAEFDPFDAGYNDEDKEYRKKQIDLVQKAYNVKITYSNWDNEAPWGPERVQFIKDRYNDGEFQKKGVYIVNITSQWIPTLVKGNALAPLYKASSESGPFREVQFGGEYYEQNSTVSECCAVRNIVYGYSSGSARPDYFLYYNATLAASIGMEDPAELWFKGEWTWSTFDKFVKEAQVKLGENQFAIDCEYSDFVIGAVAAQGNQMNNTKTGATLIAKSHVSRIFDKMRAYYQSGIWDKGHGVQDVSRHFLAGYTIFHSGELWYLNESTRFDPDSIDFEIGMVPYPTADTGNVMTPITEPYSYLDTQGNVVEVTEPLVTRTNEILRDSSGNPIYGIDLSESSYRCPFVGVSNGESSSCCYSFMNYENAANGINTTILFAILHDMLAGVDCEPFSNLTTDEIYRIALERKLDQLIDVEVVMSVQSNRLTYYEPQRVLSMTVGNGTEFGSGESIGFRLTSAQIMTSQDAPSTVLKSVEKKYQAAMEELGY